MRIAVTGASGFVGGAVCRAAVAAGHDVVAFGRRGRVASQHVAGAPYVSWDLTGGPLCHVVDGHLVGRDEFQAVVHCAGSVSDWGPAAALRAVNVAGTVNVLTSFSRPARFVHVSTASVYDPRRPTVAAREDSLDPARPPRHPDAYGRTKTEAELAVRTRRPDAVILRPHAVYGPGDTTLLPRVLAGVRGRRLLAVGDGTQRLSLTAIDNLVRACLLAATTGPAASGTFNVTDAEPVVLDDALREILKARGIDAAPHYLPFRAAFAAAVVAEAAAHATGRPPRITRYAVRHLSVERTLDITAARAVLGYDPAATSFDGAAAW